MSLVPVLFLYAIWSSIFSFAKVALEYSPPLFLTGVRMALAAVVLLGYMAIRSPSAFKLSRKQFFSICFLAIFSIYFTNTLEFWGLQYLTAAKACFIYSLSPFFAALFSYLHFGERMNLKKWLGLGVGFVGILPVLYLQTGAEETWHAIGFLSWPALAVIGAALCSVYGWVLLRLLVKDQMVSPMMANGSSMLLGGLMALLHSSFVESWHPIPVSYNHLGAFFFWTSVMAFISNILCYNLYGLLLKKFTATFLSFVGLLSPIFASIHGWIFLNEPFSWVILLSTTVVSFGLWIVYAAELKQGYITTHKNIPIEQPN